MGISVNLYKQMSYNSHVSKGDDSTNMSVSRAWSPGMWELNILLGLVERGNGGLQAKVGSEPLPTINGSCREWLVGFFPNPRHGIRKWDYPKRGCVPLNSTKKTPQKGFPHIRITSEEASAWMKSVLPLVDLPSREMLKTM